MLRVAMLLLALVGLAQAQSAQIFYNGNLSFHYAQLFGPFSGDFEVEGAIDTTNWIPTLDEGLGGTIVSVDSTGAEQMLSIGVKRVIDTDTTYHVFGVYYRAAGSIVEGPVPDALTTVQLFLIWNLDSLALPTELPDSLNIQDILGALSAEHKFVGAATGMNITNRDETTVDLTFSGTAIDLDNTTTIIFITNGVAHMEGFEVSAVEPGAPLLPGEAILLSPNPFNPSTRVSFQLERPGGVELRVHDLAGRLVESRQLGQRPAGPQEVSWSAAGLPSGSYQMSILQAGQLIGSGRALYLK